MEISGHARERWLERFNPNAQDPDGEILEAISQAVEIFREDDGTISYLVKDNMLFVHDLRKNRLATVVDIVFGFDPEINLEICRMQIARVLKVKEELESLEDFVRCETEEIDHEVAQIDDEIKKARSELDAKEAHKRTLICAKEKLIKEQEAKRAEYLSEVNKLRYSINYRLEMLKQKGGSSNAKKSVKSA
ncbi:MAG: hypothetical protein AB1523_00165 [Bacillota bacterium]